MVDGEVVPSSSVKCLGYWWSGDLGASRAVEENVGKAFFHLGSLGVYQSAINTLGD